MVSIATKAGESTARTRAYRKRRREHVLRVAIDVFPADISYLVAEGYLKGSRKDQEAVARAVERFLASSSIGGVAAAPGKRTTPQPIKFIGGNAATKTERRYRNSANSSASSASRGETSRGRRIR
jgi:hypothetical protein